MPSFNVEEFRSQFPLLTKKINNANLVYFDNAATTQKPHCVIDKYQEYYQQFNANVHRASHQLSTISTNNFEKARDLIAKFINAEFSEEVIWTKGSTESVNLLANSLGDLLLEPEDEIILSQSEHHANIVPWQMLAEKKSLVIKVAPLTHEGVIDVSALQQVISSKTKIISVAHISNVIGKINPIQTIVQLCKNRNIISIIDGAQATAHQKVNVKKIGCDFYYFSAHKMFGPTGVGVLYGKKELLNRMPPYQGGGEMITHVSFEQTTYNKLPYKFEPGTPNIAGVIAFSCAINFITKNEMNLMIAYENTLLDYCFKKLDAIKEVKFIVEGKPDIPLFSFTLTHHHIHDVASFLDTKNIAIRAGHHCAMPLMQYLNVEGCIRVSISAYNTIDEIDYLISSINEFLCLTKNSNDIKKINSTLPAHKGDFFDEKTLLNTFSLLKGWDSRHRQIMLLGKNYQRIATELLVEDNLVKGCESNAWLTYKYENGIYEFIADSDAKIIRGLIVIVLSAFNYKSAESILAFDIQQYFTQLGLSRHLSPSRSNGLQAIVNKIKEIVTV